MKKKYLNTNSAAKKAIQLIVVAAAMFTACKKTDAPKTNTQQTTSDGKLAVHTSSANAGNADVAFNAYNSAFLVNSGGQTYYKKSINDGTADGTWVASLDILVAEDAYERTGSATHKTLLNNLCNTWL